ncbi:hypothetical protein MMC22_000341 [Lobaria immixta]|nr:hypothetical protein [Lobaria immixta]
MTTAIPLPTVTQATLAAVLFYAVYYIHWELTVGASRRRMIQEHGCKPIRPFPELETLSNTVVGWKLLSENIAAYKRHQLLQCSAERYGRLGNTIRTKVLFDHFILTIEPENLKTVLATKFKDWNLPDQRKSAFLPLLGHGIFTTDGAAWQHSRELLRPNFIRSQVGDLNTFESHVGHLIQAIPRDNSTIDLQELFFRLTIDSATEFLFGESTNCLAPRTSTESNAEFAAAFNRSQSEIAQSSRSQGFNSYFPGRQFKKDVKYVHDFVDRYVARRLESRKFQDTKEATDERYIFLHELVKETQDPLQIRSELLNVLLAGRDTTASLLSNSWFVLAKRPDIWVKLRTEVEQLGGELPTYEQLKGMKYLKAVLNESLRLYPVVPANARMAVVDTVLPRGGGPDGQSPLFVPKKTVLQYPVYSMHRRKDIYGEDAAEFKPERWESLRPGWEYLPFNGGPRICIGQQFALTEASYATVRLMQEFKALTSRDHGPWEESLTLTCASRNGTQVALTPA